MKPVDFTPFGFLFLEKLDSSPYGEAVIETDELRDLYNPRTQMSDPIRYCQFLTWKTSVNCNQIPASDTTYKEFLSWTTSVNSQETYSGFLQQFQSPDDVENTDE